MATELLGERVHYKDSAGVCRAAIVIDEGEGEGEVHLEVRKPGLLNSIISERHNSVGHGSGTDTWHYLAEPEHSEE